MFIFLIVVYVIICIALITVILLQQSEGGLAGTLGGGMAESILGSRASSFLTRSTAVLATLFIVLSLALTVLSVRQSKSLMQMAGPQEELEQESMMSEEDAPADSAGEMTTNAQTDNDEKAQ